MPVARQPKAIGLFEPSGTSKHQRDWLLVELEGGARVNVPALCRVNLLGTVVEGGKTRDRFLIEDFEYRGRTALSTHSAQGSRLIDRPTYSGPALIEWNYGLGKVVVSVPSNASIDRIEATAISDKKVPDGTYYLRPKLPMDRADPSDPFPCERYQNSAAHACHWWLIEWKPERGFSSLSRSLLMNVPGSFLRCRSDTWSLISALSGDITKAAPGRNTAGTWKQIDLPDPVGLTIRTERPARAAMTTGSWPSLNRCSPKRRNAGPRLPAAAASLPVRSSHLASRTPQRSRRRRESFACRFGWNAAWQPSHRVTRLAASSDPPSDRGIR